MDTKSIIMKQNQLIILMSVLLSMSILSSCKTYYDQGLNGGKFSYMETPFYSKDGGNHKSYISAKYNKDVKYYEGEENMSGELSFHRGGSLKYMNYSYGAFLYGGEYKVRNLKDKFESLNGDYNYYGGGLRGKIAFNIPFSTKFNWRVAGVQLAWSMESGPFDDLKDDLYHLNDIDENDDHKVIKPSLNFMNNATNFTVYPYSEIAYKFTNDFEFVLGTSFGYRMNRLVELSNMTYCSLKYKRVSLFFIKGVVAPSFARVVNDDFIMQDNKVEDTYHIGLSFCL